MPVTTIALALALPSSLWPFFVRVALGLKLTLNILSVDCNYILNLLRLLLNPN